ncbi:MAG: hypothetical protein GY762_21115 [Proteobacteria bacterium]|nr:hypothetical protein [Pseudomonadota bacterium]
MSNEKQIKSLLKKAGRLKQRDEYWEGTCRLARVWITPRKQAPYRPYMTLLVSQQDKVLRSKVLEEAPTSDRMFEELLQAMYRPTWLAGGARRPKVIYLDNPDYVTDLAPQLASVEVRCEHRRSLPLIKDALYSMEMSMNRGEEAIPGVVAVPSVTLPLIGHLYELAADFYRATPWRWLNDNHPLEIRYPPDASPRYVVVMGSGGEVFGLAVYDTLADLQMMYRSDLSPQQTTRMASWLVLFFEEAIAMSFDDLDALAKYDWPVAAENAYPVFGRTTRAGEIVQPTKADAFWIEGVLASITAFLSRHKRVLHPTVVKPVEVTLPVTTISDQAQVYLRLPAFER